MNALEGGSSVGRYRIVQFLGAGAMGEVYLAEDPQIDRQLAIKTVRLVGRPQEIEERKRRLLREARAAGRLLHPNVVTLFDAGEAEGLLFLAFEYVEGTDLAARLESGDRLSLRDALRAVRQAADALDYAHGQGIVHRDIKPSNILLDRAGRVKVADFGIAKMAGQSTELTMAGSVMGSPQYLSPEQIRGEDLDGRSDIFSLGVVLYEILSGKRPFEGDTITTLVYQILHKEPPPLSELRAVPPRVEALLRGMLAKSLDDRIASAGAVARELTAIEAELTDATLSAPAGTGPMDATRILPRSTRGTVPASPATTPSVPPPPPAYVAPQAPPPVVSAPPTPARSRLPLILIVLAAVALGVAALGGGAWFALMSQRNEPGPASPETSAEPVTSDAAPGPVPATSESGSPNGSPLPANSQPIASQPIASQPNTAVPTTSIEPVKPSSPPRTTPPGPSTPAEAAPRRPEPPAVQPRTETAQPAAPEPAPVREPEPSPAPAPDADQSIRTGMTVAFRITPPDAQVLVDGTSMGMAQDWSGQKGARTFTFPDPGNYLVKIKKPGMKDLRIAVEAGAGGAAFITARLQPLPADAVDASDLQRLRVREGVVLRVQPPGANVLVDGQRVGAARQFGGGVLRPREFLRLDPGRHRISFVAPGFRRKDVLVEVSEAADRDREKIEITLDRGDG
ncbi:MAG: protein kinase domain-containing protein [Thermoanaerobaculia bacterium]